MSRGTKCENNTLKKWEGERLKYVRITYLRFLGRRGGVPRLKVTSSSIRLRNIY